MLRWEKKYRHVDIGIDGVSSNYFLEYQLHSFIKSLIVEVYVCKDRKLDYLFLVVGQISKKQSSPYTSGFDHALKS